MTHGYVIVLSHPTGGAGMVVELVCKACRRSVAARTYDDTEHPTYAEALAFGDRLVTEAEGHACRAA